MLYALGAASSTGKTTALECEAEHLARIGYRVAFVHLELSHRTMMQRAYARNAGVSLHAQRTGSLTEDEWSAVRKYEYERDNLWPGEVIYLHAPGATSTEIARRIRMTGADVFIIDYAQKMLPTKAHASLGDVVRYGPVQIEELKILAENEQAIGIIASQLTAAYQTVEPDAAAIRWLWSGPVSASRACPSAAGSSSSPPATAACTRASTPCTKAPAIRSAWPSTTSTSTPVRRAWCTPTTRSKRS